MRYTTLSLTCWLALQTIIAFAAENATLPLFRVVDLNRGEAAQVVLADSELRR